MSAALLVAPAVFFVLLGIQATRVPSRLLHGFGIVASTPDARNEVRAVYGGMPLALGAVFFVAMARPDLRAGIAVTGAAVCFGMAAWRGVSAVLDRRFGRWPMFWASVEIVLALLLAFVSAPF